jgi:ketosteroid isomerase-like protein
MQANATIITTFYECFQRRDHAGMIACCHPQITFFDPVFRSLQGKQVGAMWHMLCERGTDLSVTFNGVRVEGTHGHAHWEARYSFSASKRPVHNVIEATFAFADGKIVTHRDSFDVWRWSRMALGLPGVLLGWSPVLQARIHATAVKSLHAFIAKHPEHQ